MTIHLLPKLPPMKPLTREELEDGISRRQILSVPGPTPPPPPPVIGPDAPMSERLDDYQRKLQARDPLRSLQDAPLLGLLATVIGRLEALEG